MAKGPEIFLYQPACPGLNYLSVRAASIQQGRKNMPIRGPAAKFVIADLGGGREDEG
jgi:hypothetical protein